MVAKMSWPTFLFRAGPSLGGSSGGTLEAAFSGRIAPLASPGFSDVDYHADVQAKMVAGLRAVGNKVEENIRIVFQRAAGLEWRYDVDAIFLPSCDPSPQLMEFKTSIIERSFDEFDGSELRRKQFEMLVLANAGGGVMTRNPRVLNVI